MWQDFNIGLKIWKKCNTILSLQVLTQVSENVTFLFYLLLKLPRIISSFDHVYFMSSCS